MNTEVIESQMKGWKANLLTQKLAARLPEKTIMVFRPTGSFRKGLANDVDKYFIKGNKLFININRDGIYDMLPKRLFHEIGEQAILLSTKDFDDFFSKIANEESDARKFFLPFDSEIIHVLCEIEKERIDFEDHFFTENIALGHIMFYHLPEHLGFIPLLELAIHKSVGSPVDKILQQEATYADLLAATLKDCNQRSPLYRLVEAIPFAASISGDLQKTAELLAYVLNEKVLASTAYCKNPGKHHYLQENPDQVLGTYSLNDKFIINGYSDGHERIHQFKVFTKDECKIPLFLPDECYGRLTACFLSFFLPLGETFEIIPKCDGCFALSPAEDENTRLTERKKLISEIDKHLGKVPADLNKSITLNIKVQLKRYFAMDKKRKTSSGSSYLAFNTEL